MMDRIEVDVVEMRDEVTIVPDQMFPEASLPHIPLASRTIDVCPLRCTNSLHIGSCEGFFDQPPPRRVVGIVLWKLPDGMKVIRQDNLSLDFERMAALDVLDHVAEQLHDFGIAEQWPPLVCNEREEIAGALDCASPIAHVRAPRCRVSQRLDPTYDPRRT